MRVGLIDDEQDHLDVFVALLGNAFGIRNVTAFLSPANFLAAYTAQEFDILLIDILMPEIDGYELLRRIRLVDSITPALALTADVMPSHLPRAIAAGFCGIIKKPVTDFEEFYATVRKFGSH